MLETDSILFFTKFRKRLMALDAVVNNEKRNDLMLYLSSKIGHTIKDFEDCIFTDDDGIQKKEDLNYIKYLIEIFFNGRIPVDINAILDYDTHRLLFDNYIEGNGVIITEKVNTNKQYFSDDEIGCRIDGKDTTIMLGNLYGYVFGCHNECANHVWRVFDHYDKCYYCPKCNTYCSADEIDTDYKSRKNYNKSNETSVKKWSSCVEDQVRVDGIDYSKFIDIELDRIEKRIRKEDLDSIMVMFSTETQSIQHLSELVTDDIKEDSDKCFDLIKLVSKKVLSRYGGRVPVNIKELIDYNEKGCLVLRDNPSVNIKINKDRIDVDSQYFADDVLVCYIDGEKCKTELKYINEIVAVKSCGKCIHCFSDVLYDFSQLGCDYYCPQCGCNLFGAELAFSSGMHEKENIIVDKDYNIIPNKNTSEGVKEKEKAAKKLIDQYTKPDSKDENTEERSNNSDVKIDPKLKKLVEKVKGKVDVINKKMEIGDYYGKNKIDYVTELENTNNTVKEQVKDKTEEFNKNCDSNSCNNELSKTDPNGLHHIDYNDYEKVYETKWYRLKEEWRDYSEVPEVSFVNIGGIMYPQYKELIDRTCSDPTNVYDSVRCIIVKCNKVDNVYRLYYRLSSKENPNVVIDQYIMICNKEEDLKSFIIDFISEFTNGADKEMSDCVYENYGLNTKRQYLNISKFIDQIKTNIKDGYDMDSLIKDLDNVLIRVIVNSVKTLKTSEDVDDTKS